MKVLSIKNLHFTLWFNSICTQHRHCWSYVSQTDVVRGSHCCIRCFRVCWFVAQLFGGEFQHTLSETET